MIVTKLPALLVTVRLNSVSAVNAAVGGDTGGEKLAVLSIQDSATLPLVFLSASGTESLILTCLIRANWKHCE